MVTLAEIDALHGRLPGFLPPSRLLADLCSAALQREFDAMKDRLSEARSLFATFAYRERSHVHLVGEEFWTESQHHAAFAGCFTKGQTITSI